MHTYTTYIYTSDPIPETKIKPAYVLAHNYSIIRTFESCAVIDDVDDSGDSDSDDSDSDGEGSSKMMLKNKKKEEEKRKDEDMRMT